MTWQGWLIIVVELLFLFSLSGVLLKDVQKNTYQSEVGTFLILVFLSTLLLVFITYKKGPKPKWRWGKKLNDDLELDY